MKITNAEKLSMCREHVIEGKSLSHISEMYNNYDTSRIKYYVNLYKKYGEKPFINREDGVYKRDTKLLLIKRVKNGESIRSVALDFGLIDPKILGDWVKLFDTEDNNKIALQLNGKNRVYKFVETYTAETGYKLEKRMDWSEKKCK